MSVEKVYSNISGQHQPLNTLRNVSTNLEHPEIHLEIHSSNRHNMNSGAEGLGSNISYYIYELFTPDKSLTLLNLPSDCHL